MVRLDSEVIMVGYNDDVRTRYLIYLQPDAKTLQELSAVKSALVDQGIVVDNPKAFHHLTSLGFYSDYKLLGYDSIKSLESSLESDFVECAQKYPSPLHSQISGHDYYGSELVIKFDDMRLKDIHNILISAFKPFMILKGGIPAKYDTNYFEKRYEFAMDNYSAHISVCEVNSQSSIIDTYVQSLLDKKVCFPEIILSKKNDGRWDKMISIKI